MNIAAQSFIKNISEKKHIQCLIEKDSCLTVSLHSKSERVAFIIRRGEIELSHDVDPSTCDYEITGEADALRDLLAGNEPLRQLAKKGRIENTPHFRITLLLESLFILTKSEKMEI